ncbi:zinc-ribbon domain-containing protein [Dietzia sp. SLG310A2-38A2]|uniref:zinc-ribbon domain-containing protein n=1 Tax=Dietzia sp. SLG310A2-38A2 TaxID=1630643 RepID=UPI0015FCF075|nr:zinc-ribbon domain-containing protein [Dietzia sp. SLG310A2-38A2]MBB1029472.1 zinc-ribbon domain-containing protein [Dietzia sp. SLG310A2-38A2]
MLLIFGFKNSSRNLGLAQVRCPHCGNHAAQRVDRNRRAFSVFFIPIMPLGSSFSATCTACGSTTKISGDQADRILAGAY